MKNPLRALARLLPKGVLRFDPPTLQANSSDAWMASALPTAVAFPRNTAQVSKILAFAKKHRIPVTTRGGGRGYVGGCVPVRGGLVLSLVKINRILDISPRDGVAVVQAGVITAKLSSSVARRRLYYPPDPASLKESTLGGNIATNAGGPRCLKYGVTRSYVLGLQVVLADGTIVRLGGRTHKNRTGFDFVGLFTGSEGMLGIVTEATLRLIPLPPARSALLAEFSSISKAAAGVQKILGSGLLPAALEIADPFTLAAARKAIPHAPKCNSLLIVEFDGQPASVKAELRTAAKVLRSSSSRLVPAQGAKACEKLWAIRRGFSYALRDTGLLKLNEDVTVPRGRVLDLFRLTARLQKKHGVPISSFGHAGDGNIHVNLMAPTGTRPDDPRMHHILDELFREVLAMGGAISGEHGIGLAKKPWWNSATTPSLRHLHAKIKRALDPSHLLNPGKYLN
ncbi:MAG: FAD-binding protein [Verrucomicrobia bacterium]|nr:FAD-binding protein [Verrucomicrobiota bacterium]